MYKKVGISIILVCTLLVSMALPTFAVTGSDGSISNNITLYTDSSGTLTWQTQVTAMKPYLVDIDYDPYYRYSLNNSSLNASLQSQIEASICQDYIVLVRLANNSNYDLFADTGFGSFTFATSNSSSNPNYYSSTIKDIHGSLSNYVTSVTNGGYIQIRWDDKFTYNSGLVVPSKSVLYCMFTYSVYYYFTNSSSYLADLSAYSRSPSSITLGNPKASNISTISDFTLMNSDYNSIITNEQLDDIYNQVVQVYTRNHNDLITINNSIQAILAAYTNNASNVTETQSNISDTDSTITSVHDQEQSFYVEHQSAIEEVGLSNFALGDPEVAGTTSVINDFSDLWTNIGPVQIIFTFSLTMSLASYLLKHKPFTKTRDYVNRNSG